MEMGLEVPQISALWIARTVTNLPPGSSENSWEWGATLVPAGMGPRPHYVAETRLFLSTGSWTALCSRLNTARERTTDTLKEV